MNFFGLIFLLVTGTFVLCGSRRAATIAFLVGCCYMTTGQKFLIAGANLPIIRVLVLLGVVRIVVKGENLVGGLNKLDQLVIAWASWLFFASFFHQWVPGSGPKYIVGSLIDTVGFYFLIRSFCQTQEDLKGIFIALSFILTPVAITMFFEQAIRYNAFSIFGGLPDTPTFRNGRYRAQGPFNHAILAGTVGAACFPLILSTWQHNRVACLMGVGASIVIILTSASSGPIMAFFFAVVALGLWKFPSLVQVAKKAAIPVYLALMVLMERPPYYLISKIDLTGSSTGWHRSFLIEQTGRYFGEWWLFGTDRTIHWMPKQGKISENHTDITNQFISYGVAGGLLCMMLFIVICFMTFRTVGLLAQTRTEGFLYWCIGASFFSLIASGVSVSYFGQSIFFLWLPIAILSSFREDETAPAYCSLQAAT